MHNKHTLRFSVQTYSSRQVNEIIHIRRSDFKILKIVRSFLPSKNLVVDYLKQDTLLQLSLQNLALHRCETNLLYRVQKSIKNIWVRQ